MFLLLGFLYSVLCQWELVLLLKNGLYVMTHSSLRSKVDFSLRMKLLLLKLLSLSLQWCLHLLIKIFNMDGLSMGAFLRLPYYAVKQRMSKYFLASWSFLRINFNKPIKQVDDQRIFVLSKQDRFLHYHLLCLLNSLTFKRRPSIHHLIKQHSQGPNINFVSLLLSKVYFWSHVLQGATKSLFGLIAFYTGSKVRKLRSEICC